MSRDWRQAEMDRVCNAVEALTGPMLALALRSADSRADAEDICQQAALSLIKHVEQTRGMTDSQLNAYIMSSVRNAVIDRLRRRGRYPQEVLLTEAVTTREQDTPEAALLDAAGTEAIWAAYIRLGDADRDVIRLKCFERLDDREVGRILGTNAASVRMRLSRARQRLRRLLAEEGIEV